MKRLLFLLLSCSAVYSQNAVILPWTPQQFTNTNGALLVSGKVCTYLAGTSTGTATFTDSTASVQNAIPPNAILLDSTARPTSGGIWLTPGKAYKIVTMTAGSDSTCNTGVVVKTQDNVSSAASLVLNLPETTAPSGLANIDLCYGDSASHSIKCNYNNGGFSFLPLTGTSNQWTALQTFNSGTLLPSAPGATDLGSTSFPFGNLWLGTGSTNNFKFAPATTSAARIISIPDPGVNTNLALNLTATSAAFATATTAGTCVQSTTAVTGATTTMVASASPVSTPGVGAVWSAFVSSAGNVTINECAVATSAGGSIAFNIRVTP